MAKDPAFLFYPGDYISGTMHLNFEEKGAYIDLLMLQFNQGHMTYHMIGRVLGQSLDKVWPSIQDKFITDSDGRYFNNRLDEEKLRRQKYTDSRRNNVSGNNQHTKKQKNKGGHMTGHMENENINENENIDRSKTEKVDSQIFKNIISELNSLTGSEFKHTAKKTIELISSRINDGYTEQDIIDVIILKSHNWKSDPDMGQYLRPSTLFRKSNFENYIQEVIKIKKNPTIINKNGGNKNTDYNYGYSTIIEAIERDRDR